MNLLNFHFLNYILGIKWFCSRPENQILIQIPVEYIEDSFNLTNLDAIIPNIEDALNVILDYEVAPDFYQQAELNSRALYGLIHAR